jgi:hypothetical protein
MYFTFPTRLFFFKTLPFSWLNVFPARFTDQPPHPFEILRTVHPR